MATAFRKSNDRCEPIRQNIVRLEAEIDSIEVNLAQSDELHPDVIKKLKVILRQDKSLLARLQQTLVRCEAIPEMPKRD